LEAGSELVEGYRVAVANHKMAYDQAVRAAVQQCEVAYKQHMFGQGVKVRVNQGFALVYAVESYVGNVCPWDWACHHSGNTDGEGFPAWEFKAPHTD
jgi:hypothetical protein